MKKIKLFDIATRSFIIVHSLIVYLSFSSFALSDGIQKKIGNISGTVVAKETQLPLAGTNVVLENTLIGTTADDNGRFYIDNVPVGNYTILLNYIGYESLYISDVIVRSNRTTSLNEELNLSVLKGDQIEVKGSYFPELKSQPTSVARFSNEEIRRAATFGGDINRIINGLPSLSNENQNNYIVARGGSNVENSFYIDNIRVPNLNHFPIPGSTGGGVSLLNMDFIKDIEISTGGYPANYGDALSSVMDINYREGNREEIDIQTDLNFTGISGQIEGPIGSHKGSYMFSAKHSFTDILFKIIEVDQEPVIYDELQTKLVYDLTPKHKISLLHLFGKDRWKILRDEAVSRSDNNYGDFNMAENIIGLNWQYIWGERGFTNTSLSHSLSYYNVNILKSADQTERFNYKTTEQDLELRNINNFVLSSRHRLNFGFSVKRIQGDYDNYFSSFINLSGACSPELKLKDEIISLKSNAFLTNKWNPIKSLEIISGLRLDHFQFNNHLLLSPRIAFKYFLKRNTSVNGAVGKFYQHLPMFFLSQNPDQIELDDMIANHYILGLNHLISEDTRLSIEFYSKNYQHCPMDENQPTLFILDENIYNQFYSYHEKLTTTGEAKVQGIELLIQKKLSGHFYGLLSGTYYRSKYRDLNGTWRNRITDNKYLVSTELGYKPNAKWECSLRWSYAGGIPYTPYDVQASIDAGTGIYDNSLTMSERLPEYSSLNVRIDRRFYFKNSNLIVYISIWNLLDHENISYHLWDENYNEAGNYTQWPRLPIIGFEFEF